MCLTRRKGRSPRYMHRACGTSRCIVACLRLSVWRSESGHASREQTISCGGAAREAARSRDAASEVPALPGLLAPAGVSGAGWRAGPDAVPAAAATLGRCRSLSALRAVGRAPAGATAIQSELQTLPEIFLPRVRRVHGAAAAGVRVRGAASRLNWGQTTH